METTKPSFVLVSVRSSSGWRISFSNSVRHKTCHGPWTIRHPVFGLWPFPFTYDTSGGIRRPPQASPIDPSGDGLGARGSPTTVREIHPLLSARSRARCGRHESHVPGADAVGRVHGRDGKRVSFIVGCIFSFLSPGGLRCIDLQHRRFVEAVEFSGSP